MSTLKERMEALKQNNPVLLENEQRRAIQRAEREAYLEDTERLKAQPMPVGLEDWKETDVSQHRYEKYVEGVLRKMLPDLTSGQYRDITTHATAVSLIELATADWNDFTIGDAQRFLMAYAPCRERPYGGDDLGQNFIQRKWKAAVATWRKNGMQAKPRPMSSPPPV